MLTTKAIIRKLWDAQGYGNVAVWEDGTAEVIAPGAEPSLGGKSPLAVFKPIPLVGGFPMLDHALFDAGLQDTIEKTIRDAGGEITRG
ncbi:MAG: hypothetical protein GKC05_07725 [Methanomicrobiales archaeon]|nr:hypothetical protein [Methanomicrobiales archaeon]NYT21934.1 hypothetical protein [Methanomicrobiales archaeon]